MLIFSDWWREGVGIVHGASCRFSLLEPMVGVIQDGGRRDAKETGDGYWEVGDQSGMAAQLWHLLRNMYTLSRQKRLHIIYTYQRTLTSYVYSKRPRSRGNHFTLAKKEAETTSTNIPAFYQYIKTHLQNGSFRRKIARQRKRQMKPDLSFAEFFDSGSTPQRRLPLGQKLDKPHFENLSQPRLLLPTPNQITHLAARGPQPSGGHCICSFE